MTDAKEQQRVRHGNPRRDQLAEAMDNVAHYRQQYLRAVQSNRGDHPELRREFHSAVINYWIALRPFRENDAVVGKWSEARVWKTDNGEWVTGLDNLQNWVNRTRTQTVKQSSGYDAAGCEVREVSEALPMQALLRVSMILDDIAEKIDDESARPKGRVAPPGNQEDGESA